MRLETRQGSQLHSHVSGVDKQVLLKVKIPFHVRLDVRTVEPPSRSGQWRRSSPSSVSIHSIERGQGPGNRGCEVFFQVDIDVINLGKIAFVNLDKNPVKFLFPGYIF